MVRFKNFMENLSKGYKKEMVYLQIIHVTVEEV